jgi:hypothetical protein
MHTSTTTTSLTALATLAALAALLRLLLMALLMISLQKNISKFSLLRSVSILAETLLTLSRLVLFQTYNTTSFLVVMKILGGKPTSSMVSGLITYLKPRTNNLLKFRPLCLRKPCHYKITGEKIFISEGY